MTTDEITEHIVKFLAEHYRKDTRRHFYYRYPDNQRTWSHMLEDGSHLIITAGSVTYEVATHTDEHMYWIKGDKYDK
jgi:hypothetical protein